MPLRSRVVLALLAAALVAPEAVFAQASDDPSRAVEPPPELVTRDLASDTPLLPSPERFSLELLGQRLGVGPLDLGVRVGRRRPSLQLDAAGDGSALPAAARYRLAETELRTTDVGLDLTLQWPSTSGEAMLPLQPYLSLGPAVSYASVDDLPLGSAATRYDATMSLGMRGALGLTWHLSSDASLYGEYRVTRDRAFATHGQGDVGVDLFYGFSLRF